MPYEIFFQVTKKISKKRSWPKLNTHATDTILSQKTVCLNWNLNRFPLSLSANSIYYASPWVESSGRHHLQLWSRLLNEFVECTRKWLVHWVASPKVCHVTSYIYTPTNLSRMWQTQDPLYVIHNMRPNAIHLTYWLSF